VVGVIWVVGARGMLGRDLVARLDALRVPHADTDLDCDITDSGAVRRFAEGRGIQWIVNCSAYTAVDRAEDEESVAAAVNGDGPANLGRAAAELGGRVIHVSTDYVFDGEASSPYTEEDKPAPRGAYGRSKVRGEVLLAEVTPAHFIIRTAWLYGVHGKNFVYTMLRLMNERDEVSVVDDQRGSPTYTRDLAAAICSIIAADSREYGIYHYTNEGETTWFGFAQDIYRLGRTHGRIKGSCDVRAITTDRYPTTAVRPKYSVLSTEKIKRTFGIAIPTWQHGLKRFFSELEENSP
jgi:dTDP-4-dehydrorhamnose reductase